MAWTRSGTWRTTAAGVVLIASLGTLMGGQAPSGAVPTQAQETPIGPEPTQAQETPTGPEPSVTLEPSTDEFPAFYFPTPRPEPISAWRAPPVPVPWALRQEDHYYFARPLHSGNANWPLANYRYGSRSIWSDGAHTGVDFTTDKGTPVYAAGPGEVLWAGRGLFRGVRNPDDPYGIAVNIRHDFGYGGRGLYTVYAHFSSLVVEKGQWVDEGDLLGYVGSTGLSTGPHVHFEVRLGSNTYFSTRNPELWIAPLEGHGVLAGRIMSNLGILLPRQRVRVVSRATGQFWDIDTYVRGTVHGDEYYHENMVIGDLPAGVYGVKTHYWGRRYSIEVRVYPGQTSFVTFKGTEGFTAEVVETGVEASHAPPY